ncbi:TolC family protein [Olivibacter sp. SDN3]|uniref:TolC family protein n=1 Tax=Olivibacter sp. SDN3 TaxID=2764720 RepID=UPI00165175B1|nr:TolC family protein [Olivibacter sp. SDN3]QNL48530.1 TolC family protein [Olivibacter sp. SDN3]
MIYFKAKKLLVILCLSVVPLALYAQTPSLTELAEQAIAKSYDIANKELDIQADQETSKGLKEIYLPHLEAGGRYAYLNSDLTVDLPAMALPLINQTLFNGATTFGTSGNLWTANLTASMVLFSGTKAPKLQKAVEQKIKGQRIMLEKDRQEIISQVSTAYDQLALLEQVKLVLKESELRLTEEKKTANKAFKYGLITSYELNKIDIATATLEAKQEEYEGKKSLLLHQLHQLTGISLDRLALINNELSAYSELNTVDNIDNRPEIAALDAAIEANQYKVKAEVTHFIPKVQALASAQYLGLTSARLNTPYHLPISNSSVNFRANRIEAFPAFIVGIGFKWDLFDGFQSKRTINKAKIEVKKAENQRQQAAELLNLNLQKAKTTYQIANKQLITNSKREQSAKKALQIAVKEYQVGLIRPADRLSAETDYQQAALDYYQAVFNQRRAALEYLKATGTLSIDKL